LKCLLERDCRLAQNLNPFTKVVLQWFAANGRDFPWRKSQNPYHIFVAEILLRRTHANHIIETYSKLLERYPTPEALSHARINKLREFIQPLGLVKRANLLIDAAKSIVHEHDRMIPNNLNKLLALPGMGIYNSRAVLCLSFNAAVPMIDESSGRLLRRVLGLQPEGPAYSDYNLIAIAETLLPMENSREFNLGLLDIASAYCRPSNPNCVSCPLIEFCSYANSLRKI
jgi:A/G-specific adenine glycosylase